MIEISNTPVPIAMNNQNNAKNVGYTQVWEGKPSDFITVIKMWSHVPEDYLKVDSAPNPSNIILMVANEHIDWAYLRACDEYRPANSANYRSTDSTNNLRQSHNSAIERC